MKKRWKKGIGAVVFVLITVILIETLSQVAEPTYAQGRWDSESMTNSFYELEKDSLEVVAIGSSVCAAAIDPYQLYEETGINSYNMSIISEPMIGTYYWLKEMYKTQKPKVVMIEIQIAARKRQKKEEKFRRCYDYMKTGLNKIQFAFAYCNIDEDANIFDYLFPLSLFHTRWSDMEEDDFDENMAPARGFNALVKQSGIEFDGLDIVSDKLPEKYSKTDYEYLKRNIQLCRENGSEVILFKTPDSTWLNDKHNLIARRAEEMNVEFIDFSQTENYQKLGIDWKTDANDEQHLNMEGAKKFTGYIGKLLKDKFELTDYSNEDEEKLGYNRENYNLYMQEAKALMKKN